MTVWVDEFRAALDAEFAARPRVGALATVDGEGRPRVRSVVCRRVEDDGSLWVVSDARSEKNAQAAARPFGEMAFWLPSRREQFRLSGGLAVVSGDDPRRILAWRNLSDSARALFFWDHPGVPIFEESGENPERIGAEAPIPSSFELLVLSPDRVEALDLNRHPHRRRRWRVSEGWAVEEINP